MKKLFVTLAVVFAAVAQALAMSPRAIRENARFLSDRMAYELRLTPQQYEDCYEINYDFICAINPIMDRVVYGYPEYIDMYYNFLDYRNEDLRYIMTEGQYLAFMSIDYFFRPVYTLSGAWQFRVFQRYTDRAYFYFDAPRIYWSYAGGHARHHFPHGYYGGGRYHHHVYAHPRPIDRGHRHHDFGPGHDPRHDRHQPAHAGRDHNSNGYGRGNNDRHDNRGGNMGNNNRHDNGRGNGNRNDNRGGNNNRHDNHGNMGQGGQSHGQHGAGAGRGGSGQGARSHNNAPTRAQSGAVRSQSMRQSGTTRAAGSSSQRSGAVRQSRGHQDNGHRR